MNATCMQNKKQVSYSNRVRRGTKDLLIQTSTIPESQHLREESGAAKDESLEISRQTSGERGKLDIVKGHCRKLGNKTGDTTKGKIGQDEVQTCINNLMYGCHTYSM